MHLINTRRKYWKVHYPVSVDKLFPYYWINKQCVKGVQNQLIKDQDNESTNTLSTRKNFYTIQNTETKRYSDDHVNTVQTTEVKAGKGFLRLSGNRIQLRLLFKGDNCFS